jgi:hypothetical protein
MFSRKLVRVGLFLVLTIPAISFSKKPAVQVMEVKAGVSAAESVMPRTVQASLGPVDPHAIVGGGGTTSGSTFVLDGTIGQSPAASPMSGGSFGLTSGFWPSVGQAAVPKKRRGQITSQ